jgi:periplasmic protein TonB
MSDQPRPPQSDPRPSHDLFRDVTDTRPRAGRAGGGTPAVSIVAHALMLAAVVVVPLLATDTLPDLAESVGVFRPPDALPPPAPPPPAVTRTTSTTSTTRQNVAPVEPPNAIVDEPPRQPPIECSGCVVDPTAERDLIGVIGSTGPEVPQPPPPPTPPAKPVRLSAYEMPRKLHDVAPAYPTIARTANVEGIVIIEAVIAVDGSVRDARVLRSVPLLDRAALDAVKQWRYAPTRLGGVAVPVIVTVTVQFRLQR